MKVIFLGDAHLKGPEDPAQESLVRFLDSLGDIDRLVVTGDLFDFWTGTNDVAARNYRPVLEAMKRLAARGVGITYAEGNHDFSMGPFFTAVLGATVFPDGGHLDVEGKKIFVAHGDTVEMKWNYRLWRAFLRSPLFRVISKIATPALVWRVAGFLSRKSRNYSTKGPGIDGRLRRFAEGVIAEGADVVVLGHSHTPGVQRITANGRAGLYANPGDWRDGSYLIYEDGRFSIEKNS